MKRLDRHLPASEEKLLADLLAERSERIRPSRSFRYLMRQRVRQWARAGGGRVTAGPVDGRFLSFTRIWVGATCSFLLVATGLVSYSYASPYVGRGSTLYFIKRFVESVELKSARSPTQEAATYLKFSERRADEARILSEEGVIDVSTIQEMTRDLLRAAIRTKALPPSEGRTSLERKLGTALQQGKEDLSRMLEETGQEPPSEKEEPGQQLEKAPASASSSPASIPAAVQRGLRERPAVRGSDHSASSSWPRGEPSGSRGENAPASKATASSPSPVSAPAVVEPKRMPATSSSSTAPEGKADAKFLRYQLKRLNDVESGIAPAGASTASGAVSVPAFPELQLKLSAEPVVLLEREARATASLFWPGSTEVNVQMELSWGDGSLSESRQLPLTPGITAEAVFSHRFPAQGEYQVVVSASLRAPDGRELRSRESIRVRVVEAESIGQPKPAVMQAPAK